MTLTWKAVRQTVEDHLEKITVIPVKDTDPRNIRSLCSRKDWKIVQRNGKLYIDPRKPSRDIEFVDEIPGDDE